MHFLGAQWRSNCFLVCSRLFASLWPPVLDERCIRERGDSFRNFQLGAPIDVQPLQFCKARAPCRTVSISRWFSGFAYEEASEQCDIAAALWTGTARQSEQSHVPDGITFAMTLVVLRARWSNEARYCHHRLEHLDLDRREWIVLVELVRGVPGLRGLTSAWLALAVHLLHIDPEW